MLIEHDSHGKGHAPKYRAGCYRGRLTNCCLLCLHRTLIAAATTLLRNGLRASREATPPRRKADRTVPADSTLVAGDEGCDVQFGEIDTVDCRPETEPPSVLVRTADDEWIRLELPAEAPGDRGGER